MIEQPVLGAPDSGAAPAFLLVACLFVYGVLAGVFLAATPIQEASDEARHVGMVLFLKNRGRLPNLKHDRVLRPRQESTQAPLYYALGALLIADLDTTDARLFFRPRAGSPIGRADLPGSRYMFEPTGARFSLGTGTAGAIWRLRLFSVLLGVVTLVSIWLAVRRVLGGSAEHACFATLLVACNPMWLFISTSVNNDNLVGAAVALTLLAYARLRSSSGSGGVTGWVALGALAGASILAKSSALVLLPALSASILLQREGRAGFIRLTSFVVGTLLVSGWWFARNLLLYGDFMALEHHIRLARNGRDEVVPLALLYEWDGFLKSFWGVFGGFNIVYADLVYHAFFAITLLLSGAALSWGYRSTVASQSTIRVAVSVLVLNLVAVAAWTAQVWASQGRLLFVSIAPIAVVAAAGMTTLPRPLGTGVRASVVLFLLGSALYAGLRLIPGAYF